MQALSLVESATDERQTFAALNRIREDGLSTTLQLAKAGQHLACCELLLMGFNAFLADEGQPYDVVVDLGEGRFRRVQVKSATRPFAYRGRPPVYRFSFRKSRTEDRRRKSNADVYALIAMELKIIAWVPRSLVVTSTGIEKNGIELKSRHFIYTRKSWRGIDPAISGRFFEDYKAFPISE
jgi:hypothetical protein